jgi:hypothetical protein
LPVIIPLGHQFTPADNARLERVHRLITSSPDEFKKAGADLDQWTEDRVRQCRRDLAPDTPITLGMRVKAALDDLRHETVVARQAPSWRRSSRVLLLAWIVCDDRAEDGPFLTQLQRWPWEGATGADLARKLAAACFLTNSATEWFQAVDEALALAELRGIGVAKAQQQTFPARESDRHQPPENGETATASSPMPKHEWLARAMLQVKEHPEWSNARIARHVGIDPSGLSRSPEFRAAAGFARRKGSTPRSGHVKRADKHSSDQRGQDVEAYDDDAVDGVEDDV